MKGTCEEVIGFGFAKSKTGNGPEVEHTCDKMAKHTISAGDISKSVCDVHWEKYLRVMREANA